MHVQGVRARVHACVCRVYVCECVLFAVYYSFPLLVYTRRSLHSLTSPCVPMWHAMQTGGNFTRERLHNQTKMISLWEAGG